VLKSKNGNLYHNPYFSVQEQYRKAYIAAAAKFGMNAVDINNVRAAEKPTVDDEKKKFFGGAG
jgi:hypothetical protein